MSKERQNEVAQSVLQHDFRILDDGYLPHVPTVEPTQGMSQKEIDAFCFSAAAVVKEPAFKKIMEHYLNYLANYAIKYSSRDDIDAIHYEVAWQEFIRIEFEKYAEEHNLKVARRNDSDLSDEEAIVITNN